MSRAARYDTLCWQSDNMEFCGTHTMAEFYGCNEAALNNPELIHAAMVEACGASGALVLGTCDHRFEPAGYTIVILLSESHASIHTYPEHGSCFIDLFTCGTTCKAEPFLAAMRVALVPVRTSVNTLQRGVCPFRG